MKKSAVLLILLGGLVAFALIYSKSRDKQLNSAKLVGVPMREYLLPDLPVADIRKIRIREMQNTTTLEVRGDRWVVDERAGFAAAFEKINRLVTALSELKITGKNEVGPSAVKELMLEVPSETADPGTTGVQIELMNDKGQTLGSMVAGGITLTSGGANSGNWMGGVEQRYVRVPKDENTVWMVKDNMTEWTGDARAWLYKEFINVQGIQSIQVKAKDPAASWVLERADPSGTFALQGAPQGAALDEQVAGQLGALLANATFSDVHPKEKEGELLKDPLEVRLTTFEGFTYDLKLAKKKAGEGAVQQAEPESVYLSFVVKSELPKERPAAPDETPEDKKAKDEAFVAAVKEVEAKLNREKVFENWVFELTMTSVETLFHPKAGLLAKPGQGQGGGPGAGGGLPPGMPNISLPGLMPPGGQ